MGRVLAQYGSQGLYCWIGYDACSSFSCSMSTVGTTAGVPLQCSWIHSILMSWICQRNGWIHAISSSSIRMTSMKCVSVLDVLVIVVYVCGKIILFVLHQFLFLLRIIGTLRRHFCMEFLLHFFSILDFLLIHLRRFSCSTKLWSLLLLHLSPASRCLQDSIIRLEHTPTPTHTHIHRAVLEKIN